eukprot:CAMPEP_0204861042 /NCGR_PEP_ID=MMETSP1348-20121228/1172_1 /ASSEMBLY_ACC=CAM_ASM_000700 /TAXON_ID=215587 /ORGANISM="Aplanochytrium stocchinoi, Strain GSBS06" /LENGTH=55 /DNA_ID=CAMNT_0052010197 /DNA_START=786 /DNA_END=949 /DNA_ORIENTATION=-
MKARSQHHYDYLDGGGFMERMENDNERRRRKELKYKAMRKQAWVSSVLHDSAVTS